MTHVDQCISDVEAALTAGNFEKALALIKKVMLLAFMKSRTSRSLSFGSHEIDALCVRVGQAIYAKTGVAPELAAPPTGDPGGINLYLVSDVFDEGGHTPLIGDFARALEPRQGLLFVTNIDNRLGEVPRNVLDYMGLPAAMQAELCTEETLLGKFTSLAKAIARLRPARIFLFNHPHDSVAVAAAAASSGAGLVFVHHVDRAPCLGAFLERAIHVDITPFCLRTCRDIVAHRRNRFVPLVVQDRGCRRLPPGRLGRRGLITAAAGQEYKFSLRYTPSYATAVAELLRLRGGRHIHIGRLSRSFRERVQSVLSKTGVPLTSFVHVPHVTSVWQAMADFDVDLYIGSFPVRGARTAVEVMGSGTPMLWHVSSDETHFHDTHMKYAEAPTWRTLEELLGIAEAVDEDWLSAQSMAARRHYAAHHVPELMTELLSRPEFYELPPDEQVPTLTGPRPQSLQ